MEEKKILGRDSKETHSTVPTFSQLCRGRYDRARREEERKERKTENIREETGDTERKQVRQRSMARWQQTERGVKEKKEERKKKKEDSKERKQRP